MIEVFMKDKDHHKQRVPHQDPRHGSSKETPNRVIPVHQGRFWGLQKFYLRHIYFLPKQKVL